MFTTTLSPDLLHKFNSGVNNPLSPAEMSRMAGWTSVDSEISCFRSLKCSHSFLVLLWQGHVALKNEVRTWEGRVGIV
ncbi:hypothetical protein FJTKL_11237 [Diaporthe vaccinii]|uniref:Uncharacterized protein n=1 Tax=Diaporthe vaccinii TaxID=105482 RepID=A0ABR4EHS0_9PEZI